MALDPLIAPARLGQTTLSDGRSLGWAEWGPEQGTPVLLCPGVATSRSLGFGSRAVEQLGVRLVSIDRPGLGSSDPCPGRTFEGWARDVAELSEQRGLGGMSVVGCSQGAPFALACAAAGLARSASLVSATDELARPDFVDRLSPEVRKLVDAVTTDPSSAEAWFCQMGSAEGLWGLIVRMSGEADRAVYTEPSFEAAYRASLGEAFSQGPAGYARDSVLAMGEWPFDLSSITIPVDIWYGELDQSPVHSPDHGETLARRIAAAHLHVLDGEGGALLWTRGGDILRELLAHRG